MSSFPSSLFNAKDRGALREKGFKVEQKESVTIVTCSLCNSEWSCHSSEKRHVKLDQLGRHFLGHLAEGAKPWRFVTSGEAAQKVKKKR